MTVTAADGGRRRRPFLLLALALALAVVALAGCSRATATAGSTAAVGSATGPVLAPASPTTSLRTVPVSALPKEAVTTLGLIAAGGPYPYSKDGAVFGNREGILPPQPSGFYREYTVVTPGSSDRGARRIIGGSDGSRFYTSDHYASFREVVSS